MSEGQEQPGVMNGSSGAAPEASPPEPAQGAAPLSAPVRRPLFSVRGLADSVILVFLGGTVVGLAAGLLAAHSWALELFANFRLQYLGAALVSAGLGLALGHNRVAVAAALLSVGIGASLAPAWLDSPPPPPPGAPRLSLVFSNVQTENRDHRRLLALVEREQPDLLALSEVDAVWEKALLAGLPAYPHHVVSARGDNFGIALFSKLPLVRHQLLDLGVQGVPTIEAVVLFGGEELTVVVTHPIPPISGDDHEARTDGLRELGEVAAEAGPRSLIAGDFNCTEWAPPFQALLRGGLVDSRAGRGLQPSWPTGMFALRIPIDHVLHGPRLRTVRRELGESIGSDHFPVIAELALLPPG